MCTTSEISQSFHTNHNNFLDIKEESEGYDAITFEDYKITENYENEIIKEEPVDCYEIVELKDVVGIYPSGRSTEFIDEHSAVYPAEDYALHQTSDKIWDSKVNEGIKNCNQAYNNNRQPCSDEEEFTKKLKLNSMDWKEQTEDNLRDCESKGIKSEQFSPKWSHNQNLSESMNKKSKFENGINLHTIFKQFSAQDRFSFLIHDHSYHQTLNTPILNKFDSEDDGESSQEDNEVEINTKIAKIENDSSKLQNIRRASLENLENSSSSQSEDDSDSESDDSMDEDEDGIQYKEVSPIKLNDLIKSRSTSENSEDDHGCYTKSTTRKLEIFSTQSQVERERRNLYKGTKEIRIRKQSRVNCDIRINDAMDLKKCFEISSTKSTNSSKFVRRRSRMSAESELRGRKLSEFSESNQSKLHEIAKNSRNLSRLSTNAPQLRRNSQQIYQNSPQTRQNSTNSQQNQQIASKVFQNFPQTRQSSPQISTNLPQQNIVDLLTDTSDSDTEPQQNLQTNKKPIPQLPNASNPLKCPDCPTVFQDTLRLNRHKRTHQVPQFQCRSCLRKFKRKSMLKKHFCDIKCSTCPDVCTCQMDDSKDCIICQKINFRYFMDYKEHMLTQHNEIVYCKICEKNNYTVFRHKQLKHEVVRSFRCTECTSILKSKEQLEYHMEIHAKNFSCSKCSKVFTRRYLLNQHELTHENPEQFHCDICDKNFQRKFCLDKHRKVIHSDKRKEEIYLRKHRGMNGGKSAGWIKCGKCPAMFKSRESHQKHMGQAH